MNCAGVSGWSRSTITWWASNTARTSAAGFYLRAGFVAGGPEFDFEGIGPHLRMTCTLG
jgi:hypothetical protein